MSPLATGKNRRQACGVREQKDECPYLVGDCGSDARIYKYYCSKESACINPAGRRSRIHLEER
jgi:hypothetical protein